MGARLPLRPATTRGSRTRRTVSPCGVRGAGGGAAGRRRAVAAGGAGELPAVERRTQNEGVFAKVGSIIYTKPPRLDHDPNQVCICKYSDRGY
jgi:hypothetical protein